MKVTIVLLTALAGRGLASPVLDAESGARLEKRVNTVVNGVNCCCVGNPEANGCPSCAVLSNPAVCRAAPPVCGACNDLANPALANDAADVPVVSSPPPTVPPVVDNSDFLWRVHRSFGEFGTAAECLEETKGTREPIAVWITDRPTQTGPFGLSVWVCLGWRTGRSDGLMPLLLKLIGLDYFRRQPIALVRDHLLSLMPGIENRSSAIRYNTGGFATSSVEKKVPTNISYSNGIFQGVQYLSYWLGDLKRLNYRPNSLESY
ncbi:hypothetical protein HRG_015052 [Hirsutella rhossiliensis]